MTYDRFVYRPNIRVSMMYVVIDSYRVQVGFGVWGLVFLCVLVVVLSSSELERSRRLMSLLFYSHYEEVIC